MVDAEDIKQLEENISNLYKLAGTKKNEDEYKDLMNEINQKNEKLEDLKKKINSQTQNPTPQQNPPSSNPQTPKPAPVTPQPNPTAGTATTTTTPGGQTIVSTGGAGRHPVFGAIKRIFKRKPAGERKKINFRGNILILLFFSIIFWLGEYMVFPDSFDIVPLVLNIAFLIILFVWINPDAEGDEILGLALFLFGLGWIVFSLSRGIFGIVTLVVAAAIGFFCFLILWKERFPEGLTTLLILAAIRIGLPVVIHNWLPAAESWPIFGMLISKIFPLFPLFVLFGIKYDESRIGGAGKWFMNFFKISVFALAVILIIGQTVTAGINLRTFGGFDTAVAEQEKQKENLKTSWQTFKEGLNVMWAQFQCNVFRNCAKWDKIQEERADETVDRSQLATKTTKPDYIKVELDSGNLGRFKTYQPIQQQVNVNLKGGSALSGEVNCVLKSTTKDETYECTTSRAEIGKGPEVEEKDISLNLLGPDSLEKGTYTLFINITFLENRQTAVLPFYVLNENTAVSSTSSEMKGLLRSQYGIFGRTSLSYPETNMASLILSADISSDNPIKRIMPRNSKGSPDLTLTVALANNGDGKIKNVNNLEVIIPQGFVKHSTCKDFDQVDPITLRLNKQDLVAEDELYDIGKRQNKIISICPLVNQNVEMLPNKAVKKIFIGELNYNYLIMQKDNIKVVE